tara:strand:+ start:4689 stop:5360 length:672 start_codon:yes stop_codon:yes gene_type:complete
MLQFKKEDTKLIYEHITNKAPKDMVMLDVGSRTGKWLVPYVQYFPQATFHCFEAVPESYERLVRRFRKNDNVHSYNTVITNQSTQVKFYKDLDRAGWSGLRKHSYLENFEELVLQGSTLDSYNIKPYFIKLDIEGAELLALRSAEKTLESTKIIYFECNEIHFKEYNYTANDLYDFLQSKNFDIYTVHNQKLSRENFTYITADKRRYEDPKKYQSNFIGIKNV